jgi:hypothetical protein
MDPKTNSNIPIKNSTLENSNSKTIKITPTTTDPSTTTPAPISENLLEEEMTISGLDIKTSEWLINLISALIGISVFYFVPLLANEFDRPITAILLNVIPNELILGFFIVESEIKPYLQSIVWAPFLNFFANIVCYLTLIYLKWSPRAALTLNMFIWISAIIISYYI